jgi:hypothetical protein
MKVLKDQKPRRDGLIEAKGTWGEVRVGSVLSTNLRSEAWEVIDSRLPDQIEYGHTHWFKIRERNSGREHVVAPKLVTTIAHFLLESPEDARAPKPDLEPSNGEEMALLVETLGAQLLATRDNATGEIHCPDYDAPNPERTGIAPLIEHLRICHDMSVGGILESESSEDIHRIHDQSHSPKFPHVGKGGFSHRHVPEDHSIL